MIYLLDTEFVEDGHTIMPISLALVSLRDDQKLYIEFDFDEDKAKAHDFVRENVLPHLRCKKRLSREEGAQAIVDFVDLTPQFWAYYASYDWVLLCQLFGTMMDLPEHFSKMCFDLQQWWCQLGAGQDVRPPLPENSHDALVDAKWNREFYLRLEKFEEEEYG